METTHCSAPSGERLVLLHRPLQVSDFFRLVRSMVPRMSSEGTIIGAPFYVALELAPGDDFDRGTDLCRCSSGTPSYQLTNRRLPFITNHHYPLSEHARAAGTGCPNLLRGLITRVPKVR
jgi:hypothetical protein